MASLFSVSKLLAKGRSKASKRAPPTRSSSSISEEPKEKEKSITTTSTPRISLAAEQPAARPDTPKAPPGLELKSISETVLPALSPAPLAEPVEIIPEMSKQLVEESDYSVVPLAGIAIPDTGAGIHEKTEIVEEPDYALVMQPEAKLLDMEWTPLEVGDSEKEAKERVPDTVDLDGAANAIEKKVDVPQKDHTRPDDEEVAGLSRETSQSNQRLQDVEEALRVAHEELQVRSGTIQELRAEIEGMRAEVETVKREKEEVVTGTGHEIDRMAAELDGLKREKDEGVVEAEQEKQELLEEIQRLKGIIGVERLENRERVENLGKEHEEQLERIHRLEQRLEEQQEESGEVYARNRDLETRLQRYEEENVEGKDLVAAKESHVRMVEMNNENLASQLVQLQNTINATERQNGMLLDQIRQQSNELQAASKGVSPSRLSPSLFGRGITNTSQDTRVEGAIATVKLLNEEIFQTAAAMTDRLESIPKRFVVEDDSASAMAEVLKSMLGLELVKVLQEQAPSASEDYNPFIQIALQGCLIASCMRIITSWYPAEWEYGNFLVALYERIRGTGGLELALHWRKATQQSCVPSTDRNTKLVADMTGQIHALLTVCGWSKQSTMEEMFHGKFSQNLADIVSHAIRLNSLTTAGATADLVGMIVDAGKVFNGDHMVNDSPFGPSDKVRDDGASPQEVVCTVALGLKRVDITQVEADQIVIKPKVILNGALW